MDRRHVQGTAGTIAEFDRGRSSARRVQEGRPADPEDRRHRDQRALASAVVSILSSRASRPTTSTAPARIGEWQWCADCERTRRVLCGRCATHAPRRSDASSFTATSKYLREQLTSATVRRFTLRRHVSGRRRSPPIRVEGSLTWTSTPSPRSSGAHPSDPAAMWRHGDAWLAGGTWLFSDQQPDLRRLIDLVPLGWDGLAATQRRPRDRRDVHRSATCTRFAAPADWRAAPLFRTSCEAFLASFKVWNSRDGRRQHLHGAARGADDHDDRGARGHLHAAGDGRIRTHRRRSRLRHRQPREHPRARRAAAHGSTSRRRAAQAARAPPLHPHPHRPVDHLHDRDPGADTTICC